MEKVVVFVVLCFAFLLSSCNRVSLVSNSEEIQITDDVAGGTVLIKVDLKVSQPAALAKTAIHRWGDAPDTVVKQFLDWRKSTVKKISLTIFSGHSNSIDTVYYFPINNGLCSAAVDLPEGRYYFSVAAHSVDRPIPSREIAEFITDGFDQYFDIVANEVAVPSIVLISQPTIAVTLSLAIVGKNFVQGSSYDMSSDMPGKFYDSEAVFKDGYLIAGLFALDESAIVSRASFKVNGQAVCFDFDILKVVDNDTVEAQALENGSVAFNAQFEQDVPPLVSALFPSNKEANVALNINYVSAVFDRQLKATYNSPNFYFSVVSDDGAQQISGTMGESGKSISRQMDNGTNRVLFKPNTKYLAKINGVVDSWGNEMTEEVSWSFTTGNWYQIAMAGVNEGKSGQSPGDTLHIYVPGLPVCESYKMVLQKGDVETVISGARIGFRLDFILPDNIALGYHDATFDLGGIKMAWDYNSTAWRIEIK